MLGTRESWLIRTDQPGPRARLHVTTNCGVTGRRTHYAPQHGRVVAGGRALVVRLSTAAFAESLVFEWPEQCCLSCCAPSHRAQLSEVSCFVARRSCGRRGSGGAADRRGSGGAAARSGHGRAVEAEKARWPMHDGRPGASLWYWRMPPPRRRAAMSRFATIPMSRRQGSEANHRTFTGTPGPRSSRPDHRMIRVIMDLHARPGTGPGVIHWQVDRDSRRLPSSGPPTRARGSPNGGSGLSRTSRPVCSDRGRGRSTP
jgi:hypothetical protein